MAIQRRIWLGVLGVALLVFVAVGSPCAARYHILLPRSDAVVEPDTLRAYRIDTRRTMLVSTEHADRSKWDPGVLIIDWQERAVVVPSWYGRWVLGFLVWDRGSYEGVSLHDEFKMGRRQEFRFTDERVEIDWVTQDGLTKHIRVRLGT